MNEWVVASGKKILRNTVKINSDKDVNSFISSSRFSLLSEDSSYQDKFSLSEHAEVSPQLKMSGIWCDDDLWSVSVEGSPTIHVKAFIDSGARRSVIHPDLINKLGNVHQLVACGPYPTTFSVSGFTSLITRAVVLRIKCPIFGCAEWEFLILPNSSSELVIGRDFLKAFKGSLDFDNDALIFKSPPSGGVKIINLREQSLRQAHVQKSGTSRQ